MGQRSAALAEDFERAMDDLAATIERCSDGQWQATVEEGWTVAAAAQHIVGQFPLEFEYLEPAAAGKPLPGYTWDDINRKNDTRAAAERNIRKQDVLAKLEAERARVAQWLRGLRDEQLDHASALALADGASVTTQQLIEGGVLIDHVRAHTRSIQAVLG